MLHPRPEMNKSILKGLQVATDTAQDANHWWQAGARLRGWYFFWGEFFCKLSWASVVVVFSVARIYMDLLGCAANFILSEKKQQNLKDAKVCGWLGESDSQLREQALCENMPIPMIFCSAGFQQFFWR